MMRSVTGWLGGIAAGLSRNLQLVSLSLFFWGFGEGLFYDYVPLHLRDLGADAVQTGYVMALFSFGLAITMLPAGIAADRYGPHISVLISWPLGIVAMLIIAFTDTLGWFTLGWFLFGCSGFVIPPLTRYITDGRGDLTPQRALTLVFSSFSAGFMISPHHWRLDRAILRLAQHVLFGTGDAGGIHSCDLVYAAPAAHAGKN